MNLNKDPESWARVTAKAVIGGSRTQAHNVLQMALDDIAKLYAGITREVERRREVERALHEIANDGGFGAHARMRAIARKALAKVVRQGGPPE